MSMKSKCHHSLVSACMRMRREHRFRLLCNRKQEKNYVKDNPVGMVKDST